MTENTETTEATPKVKAPRRASVIDAAAGSVIVIEPNKPDVSFSTSGLSAEVLAYLTVFGLWMHVRSNDDMQASFDKLAKGELPAPRKVGGGANEPNPWRVAIAEVLHGLAHKQGKTEFTMEIAMEKALAMSREQVMAAKSDPTVVKHHAKITKAVSPLLGMLEAA